jgi:hypothetical protein
MFEQCKTIAAHIETGFAQAERGELIDGDAAVEMLQKRRGEAAKSAGMNGLFQLASGDGTSIPLVGRETC